VTKNTKNTKKTPKTQKNIQNLTAADSMYVNEVKSKKNLKMAHHRAKTRSPQACVSLCLFFFVANTKEKSSMFSAGGGILPHQKMTLVGASLTP